MSWYRGVRSRVTLAIVPIITVVTTALLLLFPHLYERISIQVQKNRRLLINRSPWSLPSSLSACSVRLQISSQSPKIIYWCYTTKKQYSRLGPVIRALLGRQCHTRHHIPLYIHGQVRHQTLPCVLHASMRTIYSSRYAILSTGA